MGKYQNANFKAQWINRVVTEEERFTKLEKRAEVKDKKMEYIKDKLRYIEDRIRKSSISIIRDPEGKMQ